MLRHPNLGNRRYRNGHASLRANTISETASGLHKRFLSSVNNIRGNLPRRLAGRRWWSRECYCLSHRSRLIISFFLKVQLLGGFFHLFFVFTLHSIQYAICIRVTVNKFFEWFRWNFQKLNCIINGNSVLFRLKFILQVFKHALLFK